MMRYAEQRYEEGVTVTWDPDDPTVVALLTSHFANASSPALERLNELTEEKRASHGPRALVLKGRPRLKIPRTAC
jgi:hypothetical protein